MWSMNSLCLAPSASAPESRCVLFRAQHLELGPEEGAAQPRSVFFYQVLHDVWVVPKLTE